MHVTAGARLGRFEVRSPIGAGGMGEVYVAYDPELGREVAIKVIRERDLHSSERVHRFVQEAKAASALDHPNVAHVYEIGSQDDLRFIAMELVRGETLRDRIGRSPLPVDEALDVALQVSAALTAAHKAGIVHRDIKPENIMIRPDGYVKVLDFGLAKLREPQPGDSATVVKTASGMAMGTIGYMAPEQFSGEHVTAAADVYSLGVVLYEMLCGTRPQTSGLRPRDLPPKLERVIEKSLAKDPGERYPSAAEMHEALRDISRSTRVAAPVSRGVPWGIVAAVLVVIAAAAGGWLALRSRRVADAHRMIARAEQLYGRRDVPGAYALAMRAAKTLPGDDHLLDLLPKITQHVKIASDPPGAAVYVLRFKGPAVRERIGTTPLDLPRFLRADYIVTVEKEGYAPATRPLSIAPLWIRDVEGPRMPGTLQVKLLPASRVPPGMVFVGGGPYRLQAWYRASDREVELGDFFIDRCEVSNADFDRFVRDGGYRRRELWKDLPVPFDEALAHFRDTTGLPGPRSWAGGAPLPGRENYPVTDVTWYEAAAFAEWSGKKLPTIYQWEKAGRYPGTRGAFSTFPWGFVSEGVDVTERANFLGKGTVPVDSMPFGMSTWGALHMAGNVSEWTRNVKPPGHPARGGSWNDATYAFGEVASFPPFYASPTVGFRCVKEIAPGESGDFPLAAQESVPVYRPAGDATFKTFLPHYEYARTPLDARIVETRETPDWRREKITFGVNGKNVIAYLYLPRGFKPPYQVLFFCPAGDVESGLRSLAASIESKLPAHIRSGRAIFSVAMEGYIDRPAAVQMEQPDTRSEEYVEYVASRVIELRRGIDYLETRPDIDRTRMAFEADSAGVWSGIILCAVEKRFRSILFVGSGIGEREQSDAPAANRINFAPHITTAKLLLQGRYDEDCPYFATFQPFYRLLQEPKRAEIFEGPHVPPRELYLRESQKWFDQTLGQIRN